jgi:hypothetical protein
MARTGFFSAATIIYASAYEEGGLEMGAGNETSGKEAD